MPVKFDKLMHTFKRMWVVLSLLVIGGCSGELDPDRIYSDKVLTENLSVSVSAILSDDTKWGRLYLDIQPTKECRQTEAKSVLMSEGDVLSAYRVSQAEMLRISPPLPGSLARAYEVFDSFLDSPSSWELKLTRNSAQEVYESTINVIALPDIEAPRNGAQYEPEDTLFFSWGTMLFSENEEDNANIVVDEIRVRQSGVENGTIHRLSISTYLQNRDTAYMEIPVSDIIQIFGQTALPIEFEYALSTSDSTDPEVTVQHGLSKEIDENLARLCETGTGDLIVRQSWRSIGVSNNLQIDL